MLTFAHGRPALRTFCWIAASLLLLLAWDASGLDLTMARWPGGPSGFSLQDNWLLDKVLHGGVKPLPWLAALWLLAGIWWPTGVLRRLRRPERVQLLLTTLLAVLVIEVFKSTSTTSCPWDLVEFGGHARYISHWSWGVKDGGGGHCFPAGHASSALCFIGGYVVLRPTAPRLAAAWLAVVLLAGLVLGLSQQLRGAHFMSHTLWTAWLCWTTAWLADIRSPPAPQG
ncbi:MAG: phosphatase PAP2 family protein [Burkholderiales bacterium]|nr:phosphatase PAP2 family protein [Burkholderiales bacterium]